MDFLVETTLEDDGRRPIFAGHHHNAATVVGGGFDLYHFGFRHSVRGATESHSLERVLRYGKADPGWPQADCVLTPHYRRWNGNIPSFRFRSLSPVRRCAESPATGNVSFLQRFRDQQTWRI